MKIKLSKSLWNKQAHDEIEVSEFYGKFAIRKGYATEIIEQKAEPTDYKNKAEKKPKKNK